jgi:3-oxoadipate enol-lactonase
MNETTEKREAAEPIKVKAAGITFNCMLEGPEDAPVVTLSNSLATNLHMWDDQMPALAEYRVLRYDKRGHGGTEAPAGPYTLEMLADDVIALWNALGIEKSHFIGLSIGGMTGQALALKKPPALQSLVLCDTSSYMPPDSGPQWDERIGTAEREGMAALVDATMARWFSENFIANQPEKAEKVRDMIRTTSVAGYVGCCRAIMRLDYTDRLPEIEVPTMVIVGEHDPGTPVAANAVIHEKVPNSEFLVIRDALHLSNMERPDDFNAAVTDFIARHA